MQDNIAFWEGMFGEALKMADPRDKKEKLLRYTYVLLGPIVIAGAWIIAVIGILGITRESIVYSIIFCAVILLLTVVIGHRRLKEVKEFMEDYNVKRVEP